MSDDVQYPNGTGGALCAFLKKLGSDGRLPARTANNYASAVQAVLQIDGDNWAQIDVTALDIEDQVARFVTLRHTDYASRSLGDYKTRFTKSVEMYREYLADPAAWKPPTTTRRTPVASGGAKKERSRKPQGVEAEKPVDQTLAPPPAQSLLDFPYPLRAGLVVHLHLPADMSSQETTRLAAFVNTLSTEPVRALPAGEVHASD